MVDGAGVYAPLPKPRPYVPGPGQVLIKRCSVGGTLRGPPARVRLRPLRALAVVRSVPLPHVVVCPPQIRPGLVKRPGRAPHRTGGPQGAGRSPWLTPSAPALFPRPSAPPLRRRAGGALRAGPPSARAARYARRRAVGGHAHSTPPSPPAPPATAAVAHLAPSAATPPPVGG